MAEGASVRQEIQMAADEAAQRTLALLSERMASRAEVESIAAKAASAAVGELLEKLGISDSADWQADRAWVARRRALEEDITRQGIRAVVLGLLMAIGTAIWFWLRSGAPGTPKG